MTILDVKKMTLNVNEVSYKVRYLTEKLIVLNSDKFEGRFGDEFPICKINKINRG